MAGIEDELLFRLSGGAPLPPSPDSEIEVTAGATAMTAAAQPEDDEEEVEDYHTPMTGVVPKKDEEHGFRDEGPTFGAARHEGGISKAAADRHETRSDGDDMAEVDAPRPYLTAATSEASARRGDDTASQRRAERSPTMSSTAGQRAARSEDGEGPATMHTGDPSRVEEEYMSARANVADVWPSAMSREGQTWAEIPTTICRSRRTPGTTSRLS